MTCWSITLRLKMMAMFWYFELNFRNSCDTQNRLMNFVDFVLIDLCPYWWGYLGKYSERNVECAACRCSYYGRFPSCSSCPTTHFPLNCLHFHPSSQSNCSFLAMVLSSCLYCRSVFSHGSKIFSIESPAKLILFSST